MTRRVLLSRPRLAAWLFFVRGLAAFALIVGGVWFIYWPAALIVAGVLLLVDRLT